MWPAELASIPSAETTAKPSTRSAPIMPGSARMPSVAFDRAHDAFDRPAARVGRFDFLHHDRVVFRQRRKRLASFHLHDPVAAGLEIVEDLPDRVGGGVLEIVHQDDALAVF